MNAVADTQARADRDVHARVDSRTRARALPGIRPLALSDLPEAGPYDVTNVLYGARGLQANGLAWHWQAVHPTRIQEWITFTADDIRLQLALDGDAVGLDSTQLDWRSYSGDTQLIAWTAAHEPLIGLLRVVFQSDLIPERIEDCDAPLEQGHLFAGFKVYRTDGSLVASGLTAWGLSAGTTASIDRLADRADGLVPRPISSLSRVEAQLPLHLDEVEIPADELAWLERGSIVRLDNRTLATDEARISIVAGHLRLIADVTGPRATVAGFAIRGGNPMSIDDTKPTETLRVVPDALPVRLTFCAGSVTVPFGKVSDIAPGYVFELDKHLDDKTISVLANDVPIATGELVTLGDLVGVRITRMLPRA